MMWSVQVNTVSTTSGHVMNNITTCDAWSPKSQTYAFISGMHKPRAVSGPQTCYTQPPEQVRKYKNFSWMTEIL